MPGNAFDHPLSSRFDEQDAFVIFDDVEVPRDRVFIDGNLRVYNGILRDAGGPNIMQQTMIRAATKLDVRLGAGHAHGRGDQRRRCRRRCRCWARSGPTPSSPARRSARSEVDAREYSNGVWLPDVQPLHALRASLPRGSRG